MWVLGGKKKKSSQSQSFSDPSTHPGGNPLVVSHLKYWPDSTTGPIKQRWLMGPLTSGLQITSRPPHRRSDISTQPSLGQLAPTTIGAFLCWQKDRCNSEELSWALRIVLSPGLLTFSIIFFYTRLTRFKECAALDTKDVQKNTKKAVIENIFDHTCRGN